MSPAEHPRGPPPNPDSHPVHLITKAGHTEQLCGPLSLRPSLNPPPRGVGWGSLPYEESYPFHHLGPLVAMREKALLCRLGRTGDEPPTEAHHLSNRGSHFGGVYPPKIPCLVSVAPGSRTPRPRSSCYRATLGILLVNCRLMSLSVRYSGQHLTGLRRR